MKSCVTETFVCLFFVFNFCSLISLGFFWTGLNFNIITSLIVKSFFENRTCLLVFWVFPLSFSGHGESKQRQTHCVWFWWRRRRGQNHKQTRRATKKQQKNSFWGRFRIRWSTNVHIKTKGKYGLRLELEVYHLHLWVVLHVICVSLHHNSTGEQKVRWQKAVWQWRWGWWRWGWSFPDKTPVWGQSWTEGLDWASFRMERFSLVCLNSHSSFFFFFLSLCSCRLDSELIRDSRSIRDFWKVTMRLKIKVIYDLYLFECVFGSKCGWCKTYSPVSNLRCSGSRKRWRATTSWREKEKYRHPPEHFKNHHTTAEHQKGQDVQVRLFKCSFCTHLVLFICL